MTSKADKLPLETEPVARDNNTILMLKPGDQTLSRLTQLIIVVIQNSNAQPLKAHLQLKMTREFRNVFCKFKNVVSLLRVVVTLLSLRPFLNFFRSTNSLSVLGFLH